MTPPPVTPHHRPVAVLSDVSGALANGANEDEFRVKLWVALRAFLARQEAVLTALHFALCLAMRHASQLAS